MNFKSVLIFFFLIGLNHAYLIAAEDWIKEAIDLSINTRFEDAETVIANRMAAGDSGAAVQFYYASILNSKMTHFENDDDAQSFQKAINEVNTICSDSLESEQALSDREKARLYFYRGSALGYLAYFQGTHNEWLKALNNGLASINDLEKAVELDSALYDAYLGIGVYKYWRSTKFKYMLWLPFVPDMREEGIGFIRKAAEKGQYSSSMAMHQLVYILLDYGKYDDAIPYAEHIVKRYPESPFMWWAHAHVYFKRHEYEKAIESYLILMELIEKDPGSNPNHLVFCNVRLAEIFYRMGRYESAIRYAQKVSDRAFGVELSEKSRDKIKQARQLIGDSENVLAKKIHEPDEQN